MQCRRRRVPEGDAFIIEKAGQFFCILYELAACHAQCGSCRKASKDVVDAQVKADGGYTQDFIISAYRVGFVDPLDEVDDRLMFHHHTFGGPCGTRCVNDISHMLTIGHRLRIAGGHALHLCK